MLALNRPRVCTVRALCTVPDGLAQLFGPIIFFRYGNAKFGLEQEVWDSVLRDVIIRTAMVGPLLCSLREVE